ncbi:MAG: glycosyltransferase [Acidobacteria bacterium]|nr:glycosyltransferase [Acidobacteriota bacterium]
MEELSPSFQTSVLIVSRNQVDELRRTLASLLPVAGGSAPAVEVLVVDLASSDGSSQLDSEFPFAKFLRSPRHFGWVRAVNLGSRTAIGEFLCLAMPGVQFAPETLAGLVAHLEADAQALAAAPMMVDAQGTPVTRVYPLPDREMLSGFWRSGGLGKPVSIDLSAPVVAAPYVVNAPLLLRRRTLAGMNYVDERYGQFWADADICFEVRRAGKSVVLLPQLKVTGVPVYKLIPERLDQWGAILSADAALGAAAYIGKHEGFMAGFLFQMGALARSFGGVFSFSRFGPHITRFLSILSGQKIDGTQG